MSYYCIMRIEKHKSRGNTGGATSHNFRERETPNADPSLEHLNIHIGGQNSVEVFQKLNARLAEIDEIHPNAIEVVEVFVQASKEAYTQNGGTVDSRSYLNDSLNHFKKVFDEKNFISASFHFDEEADHGHFLFVPAYETEAKTRKRSVITGKDPETGKQIRETREYSVPDRTILSASHFLDGRGKMSQHQTDFWKNVGMKYGLKRGIEGKKATRTEIKEFYAAITQEVGVLTPPPRYSRENAPNYETINAHQDAYYVQLKQEIEPIYARAKAYDITEKKLSSISDSFADIKRRAEEAEQLLVERNQQIFELQRELEMQSLIHYDLSDQYNLLETQRDYYEQELESSKEEIELLKMRIDSLLDPLSAANINRPNR
ncbi:MAG: hypothetical protein EA373_13550 [Oceanospirillales bacterium]|nr:MAG: hypothetical protein EA373_13550 [Oceanospirillales bacterium]